MIADLLLDRAREGLKQREVKDIVVGLGYIGVQFDNGDCGVAATLREDVSGCCTLLEGAGGLTDRSALALASSVKSTEALQAGIGLATINAVLNQDAESNGSSPIQALQISGEDRVGMVGYFSPLIEPVQARCSELSVFERRSLDGEFVYPDWAANVLLPDCDVAIISSTAIINKTLGNLLPKCPKRTALLGPSTPLTRSLGEKGISHLFGSEVTDCRLIMRIIAEGGGTQLFGDSIQKINLALK